MSRIHFLEFVMIDMNGFIELRYAKRFGTGGLGWVCQKLRVVVSLDNVHYYLFGVIQ